MTTPDTTGFRSMAIQVLADTEADVPRIIGWVRQFELVSAIGSWDCSTESGEVAFFPWSLEQYARVAAYVASWEGETTPTVAACEECCAVVELDREEC